MPDHDAPPLRLGLAGYGLAGEVFHAPLIAATPGLALSRVLTRDPARVARARARYPDALVVDSFDDLLTDVDAVVVATPNRTHVEMALAALDRDVAVIVDKPLAVHAAAARRLVEAGGRLTVFQNRRWDGDFLTARNLVADGALGPITRFESRFERYRPVVAADEWRESADPADGGGVLLDLGSHLVDQAILLLGPVREIRAEVDTRRPGARAPDDVFLALHHEAGARSHLWMSAVAPLHGPRLRLSGLRGGFAVDGLDPQEAELQAGATPRHADYGLAPPGRLTTAEGTTALPLMRGSYDTFYAMVRDWLRGDGPVPVDPADALAVLELLERAAVA